jgi:CheY-like chemotaxis protein/predicted ester cyclase
MAKAIRLLVADDDLAVLESMTMLFQDEGYEVVSATSLAEAIAAVERETFACVLADLFEHAGDVLAHLAPLREAAYPTPVGVTSAWRVVADDVLRAGFACFIARPFEVNDLLSAVAAVIHRPLTPKQARQAVVIQRLAEGLNTAQWDAVVALCSDDLSYVPADRHAPPVRQVIGRSGYRAYLEEMAPHFPAFRISALQVVPTPHRLAARFTAHWQRPGGDVSLSTGLVLKFNAADQICEMGVRLTAERLRALLSVS